MNKNELFGSSVLLRVPGPNAADEMIDDHHRADKNFEVVYYATETFENGVVTDVAVYRITNPLYDPRQKRNPAFFHIAETTTEVVAVERNCQ
jgi:predicted nucleotidyltransferase component of viral defense system